MWFPTAMNMMSPWRRLQRMQREMDTLLRDWTSPRAGAFPAVNVWTNAEGAVVTAELPGVDPETLDVTAQNNSLTIRGERSLPEPDNGGSWHRRERRGGSFARVFDLPFRIDPDTVSAAYEHGVLKVTLSRHEAEKPRKITVQAS